jgi:hypothetical protein
MLVQTPVSQSTISTAFESTIESTILTSILTKSKVGEYKCENCNWTTQHRSSYYRHKSNCKKKAPLPNINLGVNDVMLKKIADMENKLNQLTEQISEKNNKMDQLTEKLTEKDKMIDSLIKNKDENTQNEIKHLRQLTNNAGSIIKKSVGALAYVSTHYPNAPAIEHMPKPNYQLIKQDYGKKKDLISTILHFFECGEIESLLGEFVVKTYKTQSLDEQSIHNSDAVRLTFILRKLVNKKPTWVTDRNGLKTGKFLVDPLLAYLREQLVVRISECGKKINNKLSVAEIAEYNKQQNTSMSMINVIDNQKLKKGIMKFIVPYFHIMKYDAEDIIVV